MKKSKKKKKRVHRHLKIKPFLMLVSFLLVIGFISFYLYNLRIKNIYITGTNYLNDYEVINIAKIKDYPKIFSTSSKTLEKRIKKLALVNQVDVKKNIFGSLTINIDEATPLFYNRNTSSYILSNGHSTNDYPFVGIPFLINIVPDDVYKRLIRELGKISSESLQMVSEIEYAPSMSGEITIDKTRFLLRMNDGNQVYINLIHMDRLDLYPLAYTVFTEKGRLQLDSDNEYVSFTSYKRLQEEEEKQKSGANTHE